jgi:hypothetical protein
MSAKEIIVKPISSQDAARIVKSCHYSGKVVQNSQLHFGVFLDGKCGGAMQFGPSLDKRKIQGLVENTGWNGFLELNRMAFADWLPRNSESRAIAVAMRLIRNAYPHIEWVVSFADGAQCGDGTIYRASGFVLTSIKKNNSLWSAPNGDVIADITVKSNPTKVFSRTSLIDGRSKQQQQKAGAIVNRVYETKDGKGKGGGASMKLYQDAGFKPIPGFQLRYIYFLNPAAKSRLTVPILPFSEIERRGAGMYLGKPKRAESIAVDAPCIQQGEGSASLTSALQSDDL